MAETGTPGASVAIVKDGQVLLVQGFGVREVGQSGSVDSHTVFAIGSLTKSFTAAAISMLVDEGKASFDKPVSKYVPNFGLDDPYRTQYVTLRDLLSHRTGLGDTDFLAKNTSLSGDDIINRVRHVPLTAGFRERFIYQNTMYMVVGRAIEHLSGSPWGSYVHDRLLVPLQMTETTTGSPKLLPPNHAAPHLAEASSARAIEPLDIWNEPAAGAMYSSAADMAKWLAFQIDAGAHTHLVSEKSFAEAHSPQIVRQADPVFYPEANFVSYGFASILWDYHGYKVISHDGAINGMTAKMCIVPAAHLGVVVLSNAEVSLVPNIVIYDALDRMLGLPRHNWEDHFVPVMRAVLNERAQEEAKIRARVINVEPQSAQAMLGVYSDSVFDRVEVLYSGSQLHIRMLGLEVPLAELDDHTFIAYFGAAALDMPHAHITFAHAAAKPATMEIEIEGQSYLLPRAR